MSASNRDCGALQPAQAVRAARKLLPRRLQHLRIMRNFGQFVPYSDADRRIRSWQHKARAALPQRRSSNAVVSVARIRPGSRKSVRPFKGIICGDIVRPTCPATQSSQTRGPARTGAEAGSGQLIFNNSCRTCHSRFLQALTRTRPGKVYTGQGMRCGGTRSPASSAAAHARQAATPPPRRRAA